MAAPAVAELTRDVYDELPEAFRSSDEQVGWPLLRYLACLGDQGDEVAAQLRLLEGHAVADPTDAPVGWLDWMAQFVALPYKGLTAPEKRVAIGTASSLLAGSLASMRAAIEALLGGEKRYLLVEHDSGNAFKVHLYINADDALGSTWATLAVQFPSWNAWQAAGSWDNLETVAPIAVDGVLATVKPAWILLTIETLGSGFNWLFFNETYATWASFQAAYGTWADFQGASFAWP